VALKVIAKLEAGSDKRHPRSFCAFIGQVKFATSRNIVQSGNHLPIGSERREISPPQFSLFDTLG